MLPPGLEFSPTDEELLDSYLRRKLLHRPLPSDIIIHANVYDHHPKNLTDRYRMLNKNCEWFFFSRTTRKHAPGLGSRASRCAGSGRWKATKGVEKVLKYPNHSVLGWKQKFCYMEQNPCGGEKKSIWLMEEYSIHHRRTKDSTKPDEWVIYKIYLTPKARRAYMPPGAELETQISGPDIADYSHIVQQQEDNVHPVNAPRCPSRSYLH